MLARVIDWQPLLVVVRPETLLRWHHQGFRLFWRVEVTPLGSSADSSRPPERDCRHRARESDLGCLIAENLFLRKQLGFYVERTAKPQRVEEDPPSAAEHERGEGRCESPVAVNGTCGFGIRTSSVRLCPRGNPILIDGCGEYLRSTPDLVRWGDGRQCLITLVMNRADIWIAMSGGGRTGRIESIDGPRRTVSDDTYIEESRASGTAPLPPVVQQMASRDIIEAAGKQRNASFFPLYAGQGVGMIDNVPSASAVVRSMIDEARATLEALPSRAGLQMRVG